MFGSKRLKGKDFELIGQSCLFIFFNLMCHLVT